MTYCRCGEPCVPRSAAVLRMCTLLECNVMLWAYWERAEVTRHV